MDKTVKSALAKFPLWLLMLILTGLGSCWLVTGAPGLLAHPLRKIMVWIMVVTGILFAFPYLEKKIKSLLPPALGLVLLILFTPSSQPVLMIFALAVLWACLSFAMNGIYGRIILSTALAISMFGFYVLAGITLPVFRMLMDGIAGFLGSAAGLFTGQAARIGSTFAGLDFLVLMLLFYSFYLCRLEKSKRIFYALRGFPAIAAGHFLYLVLVSLIPAFLTLYESIKPAVPSFWNTFIEKAIPWNFPLCVFLIHVIIIICICRWTIPAAEEAAPGRFPFAGKLRALDKKIAIGITALLALGLVLITTLYAGNYKLAKRKVVFYEKGFLNWLKPEYDEYGRFSIGMYGMLPYHLGALGSTCVISPDLAEEDLQGADLVVLIYPNDPWQENQLNRIRDYVRKGGTLLVLGEHTVEEKEGGMRFNDVLEPTGIRVLFDSGTFQVGGWLQSYETLAHPVTLGFKDDENQFGIVIGASLQIKPPARPVIMGKWGWSDRGDLGTSSYMGNGRYDSGEQLGDLVLAAEQDFGKGRVFVFGDTSLLSNGIILGCHAFVYRLLGYLSGKPEGIILLFRSLAGILLLGCLIYLILIRKEAALIIASSLVVMLSFTATLMLTYNAGKNIPGKDAGMKYKIAYIDAAHVNAYSAEAWRPDGTMGIALNLMRNGYLTLMLREFDNELVLNSDLLLVIAPLKRYTAGEIALIDQFVRKGGKLICTVGYTEKEGSANLLTHFGFNLGGAHDPPEPMGFFKAPYLNISGPNPYYAYVRFYAGWPVTSGENNIQPVVYGTGNLPVIQRLPYGDGSVTVIGDTAFAMNKNLENEGGEPFEGMRENADFWRWYLGYLEKGETTWIPPRPGAVEIPGSRTDQVGEE